MRAPMTHSDLEPRLEPSEGAPLLGVRSQALRQAVERLPGRVRGDTDREGDEEDRGVLATEPAR